MAALALLIRTAVCFFLVPAWEAQANVAPAPDAYPVLADTLLEDGTLGFAGYGASPTTTRGPVFPAWLAAGILVGSRSPAFLAFWGSLAAVAAAAWVAFEVTRRAGTYAGLAAGLIAAAHPLPAWVSGRVMSDEFYGALGFAATAALARGLEAHGRRRFAWFGSAGVLLASHMLTRSTGVLTALALLAALWLTNRIAVRTGILIVGLALVPALAWSVRSSLLEQRVVFVQSLNGFNFWMGEAFDRLGPERDKGDLFRARTEIVFSAAGEPLPGPDFWWIQLTPEQLSRMEPRLHQAALQHIAADPLGYATRLGRGLWHFWFRAETQRRSRQYMIAVLPLLVPALLGGYRAVRVRADLLGVALALSVLLHWLAYAAIVPLARFSAGLYPALAFLCIAPLVAAQRARPGRG